MAQSYYYKIIQILPSHVGEPVLAFAIGVKFTSKYFNIFEVANLPADIK
jgi:hypothetical protein